MNENIDTGTETRRSHGRPGMIMVTVALCAIALLAIIFSCANGCRANRRYAEYKDLSTKKAEQVAALEEEKTGLSAQVLALTNDLTIRLNDLAAKIVPLEKGKAEAEKLAEELKASLAAKQAGFSNQLATLEAKLKAATNAPASPAPATPAVSTATNAAPSASATCANKWKSPVLGTDTNTIFFSEGVYSATAPTGMTDGVPFLVDNTSTNTVNLTMARVPGPGSVNLDVTNTTRVVLFLLPGNYDAGWEVISSGRTNYLRTSVQDPPNDLVVGLGRVGGWLRLIDRPRRY